MGSESGAATTNNSSDPAVPAFLGGTGGAGTWRFGLFREGSNGGGTVFRLGTFMGGVFLVGGGGISAGGSLRALGIDISVGTSPDTLRDLYQFLTAVVKEPTAATVIFSGVVLLIGRELGVELELDAFVIVLEIKLGVGLFDKLSFGVEGRTESLSACVAGSSVSACEYIEERLLFSDLWSLEASTANSEF